MQVRGLDSRTADATGEEDKRHIFDAIQQLPGAYDTLNANVQLALKRWMAKTSEGVIHRTNPYRTPLNDEALAREVAETGEGSWLWAMGASQTSFLEKWPQLSAILWVLGCICAALALYLEGLADSEVCHGHIKALTTTCSASSTSSYSEEYHYCRTCSNYYEEDGPECCPSGIPAAVLNVV